MRLYCLADTADANIKGCGLWVHYRTTLLGIAPRWWYRDRSANRAPRRLGINILTPARHYDRFQFVSVECGRWRWGVYREQVSGPLHIGRVPL